ncbi:hypothetical protein [Clostridium sp.]|uniref:hypothetical protein n=1 Tax=Clostridium sp. TaxID=1506 RepID=UPI003464C6BB
MKKIISVLLSGVMILGLTSCGSTKKASDGVATVSSESSEKENEKVVDGVKFTIGTISSEDIKGDMNSDGSMNIEKGEYFQFGTEVKNASDYKYVVIDIKVENTTDKVVKLFQTGWNASLKDGYELKNIKVTDKLNNEQVPSKYAFDAQVKIPMEKNLKADEIKLKYNLKDYSNLPKVIKAAAEGKTKEDIQKEYPELYKDNFIDFGTLKIK